MCYLPSVFKGYVVEGVAAAGKTYLFVQIQRQLAERNPQCTKLLLSEHITERALEGRYLTSANAVAHSRSLIDCVRTIHRVRLASPLAAESTNASVVVLIERFLGSQAANLMQAGRWDPSHATQAEVDLIYQHLDSMGLQILLLWVPERRLLPRIADTLRRRNARWGEHITESGGLQAAVDKLLRWQHDLFDFYSSLACPYRTFEVSEDSGSLDELARSLTDSMLQVPEPV